MADGISTGRVESPGGLIESVGFLCLTCFCVATGIAFVVGTVRPPTRHVLFEIDDTINPNDASPASLARLPRIGPARARAIVSYRRQVIEGRVQGPAFSRAEDLRGVTGIGPATIEAVRPWLSFESRAPEERASADRRP
jgi:hypothetical protein